MKAFFAYIGAKKIMLPQKKLCYIVAVSDKAVNNGRLKVAYGEVKYEIYENARLRQ